MTTLPRWLAALFAVLCIACTGLVSAPAAAEPAWQAGAALDTLQAADAGSAPDGTDDQRGDAQASDPGPDQPDLIGTPRFAVLPAAIVRNAFDAGRTLPPSPHLDVPQRPPRPVAISA